MKGEATVPLTVFQPSSTQLVPNREIHLSSRAQRCTGWLIHKGEFLPGNVNWQFEGVAATSGGSSFAGVWSEVPARPVREKGSCGLDIDIRAAFVTSHPKVEEIELGEPVRAPPEPTGT